MDRSGVFSSIESACELTQWLEPVFWPTSLIFLPQMSVIGSLLVKDGAFLRSSMKHRATKDEAMQ